MEIDNLKEIVADKWSKVSSEYERIHAAYTLYGFFNDCIKEPEKTDLAEIASYYEQVSQFLSEDDDKTIQFLYEEFYNNLEYLIQSVLKAKKV